MEAETVEPRSLARRPPDPGPEVVRVRLAPARPPERRARAGQLGVAVVLVALGVLGAYWFSARGDAKVQVAVLARDLRRGETITAADLALTRAMVSDGTAPAPGKAVVGLNLSPGEYPVDGMTPGVAVAVVRAPKTGPGEMLIERAEICAVASAPTGSGSSDVFVSLTVDQTAVAAVSAAASAGEVRLAVVP